MYINGELSQIEDKVLVGDDIGYIKAIIHDGFFSEDLNLNDWDYLEYGYLISIDYGILYTPSLDEDIILLDRQ